MESRGQAAKTLLISSICCGALCAGITKTFQKTAIGIVAGTLLYFVAPLDLLPDFLPAVGYIDDFAVIAFAVNAVREEIERFRLWRGSKTRASADAESHAATTAP